MIKKTLFAALLMAAACPAFAQTAGQNADVTETVEYSTEKYKVVSAWERAVRSTSATTTGR